MIEKGTPPRFSKAFGLLAEFCKAETESRQDEEKVEKNDKSV